MDKKKLNILITITLITLVGIIFSLPAIATFRQFEQAQHEEPIIHGKGPNGIGPYMCIYPNSRNYIEQDYCEKEEYDKQFKKVLKYNYASILLFIVLLPIIFFHELGIF